MQKFGLHKNIYKLSSYALRHEKRSLAQEHYLIPVQKWEKLKNCSLEIRQEFTGISRATYYRYKSRLTKGICPASQRPKNLRKPYWGESEKQAVLRLRRENPTYGKAKIALLLKRDHGFNLSESTVGRILKHLMTKGLIQLSLSAPRKKRKREFTGHAKPWVYGIKAQKIGQLLQIDHMTVTKNGICMKHFQAWDPVSKFIHANVYANASSLTAKRFLKEVLDKVPFPIESIQVDGGSEFMKHFEETCATLNIKLFVLPPKRPQYNGGVERGNRIFREEFYAKNDIFVDALDSFRIHLHKALHKYNAYRPHQTLKGLTPLSYIQSLLRPQSHQV